MREKNNAELVSEVKSAVEKINPKFNQVLKGQSELLASLAKERERNVFLEMELARRDEEIGQSVRYS